MYFQHHCAPLILIQQLMLDYLNRNYQNRWIDRGRPHARPARFINLNALDYPWRHIRDQSTRKEPTTDIHSFKEFWIMQMAFETISIFLTM
jgi:hypothetical protein